MVAPLFQSYRKFLFTTYNAIAVNYYHRALSTGSFAQRTATYRWDSDFQFTYYWFERHEDKVPSLPSIPDFHYPQGDGEFKL